MTDEERTRRREHLIPLTPSEGVERFLKHRKANVAYSTYHNNKTTLELFLAWCREEGIDNLNDLNGRTIADWVDHRREEVKPISLQKSLSALRMALEFWADIDAVEPGLRERVHSPTVPEGDESRDVTVEAEKAHEILEYLDRYQHASREHVVLSIWWRTGIRLGGLRAIDLGDFKEEEHAVELVHRPDQGTPLKNGPAGERWVWLGEDLYELIQEYIEVHRVDTLDDEGREPLLTTRKGRASGSTIRNISYKWTQPCRWAECPHDRDPETCEAVGRPNTPSKCPSSTSPHSWRRGAITDHLSRGVSTEVISERMNVSLDILYRHYDARKPDEKMAVRRRELERKEDE